MSFLSPDKPASCAYDTCPCSVTSDRAHESVFVSYVYTAERKLDQIRILCRSVDGIIDLKKANRFSIDGTPSSSIQTRRTSGYSRQMKAFGYSQQTRSTFNISFNLASPLKLDGKSSSKSMKDTSAASLLFSYSKTSSVSYPFSSVHAKNFPIPSSLSYDAFFCL